MMRVPRNTMALILPELPDLPAPEETQQSIREALAEDGSALEHRGLTILRVAGPNPPWVGRGDLGWRADLAVRPVEPLREMLWELANWWNDAVEQNVRECPEPERGTRRYETRWGHVPISRTLWWKYEAQGNVAPPGGPANWVNIQAMIRWDGRAPVRDTLWPFALTGVTGRITAALRETLEGSWTNAWEESTTSATRSRKR